MRAGRVTLAWAPERLPQEDGAPDRLADGGSRCGRGDTKQLAADEKADVAAFGAVRIEAPGGLIGAAIIGKIRGSAENGLKERLKAAKARTLSPA